MKTSYKFIIFTIFYIIMVLTFGGENSDLLLVFLSLSLMIPIVYLIHDRFKQKSEISRLKEETLKAELNLLKSQINPHFFFNTLNNLYSLAVEKSDKTEHVIYKLSEMMRFTIYDGRKDTVSIRDEINYLNNFIELNRIRYKQQIKIAFNTEIENEDQRIPPLLFINLLENAFKHGVDSMTDSSFITMELKTNTQHIDFKISNNFDPDHQNKKRGIGQDNLKRRLELLFPKKHMYDVKSEGQIYTVDVRIELS
jgi:two-component system sensor histidine kinase AlgZ